MSDHLIVIPVFDEAPTLEGIVSRARRHGPVLVVDDGSRDGSGAVASAAGADLLRLDHRRGKGEALRHGWRAAMERGVDRVVTLDGDGQHDPDDIPRLLEAAGPDTLVIGGRLGGRAADVMAPGRLAALRVAGFFINWLTGVHVADTQSGLRVYPAGLLQAVLPRHGGFVLETEMLVEARTAGWRLVEVPISSVDAWARRSRFRPARDGIAVGVYLAGRIVHRWRRELSIVAAALLRPFTAERRRPRHHEQAAFAAPHRDNLAAWALATGVFTLDRVASTWRGWCRDPRAQCLAIVGVATLATPVLLALALVHAMLSRWRVDVLSAFTRSIYSQDRLARVLPGDGRASAPSAQRRPA
jgi:hypothetical protein